MECTTVDESAYSAMSKFRFTAIDIHPSQSFRRSLKSLGVFTPVSFPKKSVMTSSCPQLKYTSNLAVTNSLKAQLQTVPVKSASYDDSGFQFACHAVTYLALNNLNVHRKKPAARNPQGCILEHIISILIGKSAEKRGLLYRSAASLHLQSDRCIQGTII